MEEEKPLIQEKGITRFNRKTERSLFFYLTLIMLVWGVLEMMGWLQRSDRTRIDKSSSRLWTKIGV